MAMVTENFSAFTNQGMTADAKTLPVSTEVYADLVSVLTNEDDYMYLALVGAAEYEVVKVKNSAGVLVLERGLERTEAQAHHYGTCIQAISPLLVAVMKDLICNYTCCEKKD